mmetsp:Transcript_125303/g.313060  ORF Transcript_125303/g.313060 Transcript_125303/m.313060 type:complete len:240 (+) Transcript_125303:320-1039(+)
MPGMAAAKSGVTAPTAPVPADLPAATAAAAAAAAPIGEVGAIEAACGKATGCCKPVPLQDLAIAGGGCIDGVGIAPVIGVAVLAWAATCIGGTKDGMPFNEMPRCIQQAGVALACSAAGVVPAATAGAPNASAVAPPAAGVTLEACSGEGIATAAAGAAATEGGVGVNNGARGGPAGGRLGAASRFRIGSLFSSTMAGGGGGGESSRFAALPPRRPSFCRKVLLYFFTRSPGTCRPSLV